jgi:ribosomal-protein-alanine N-acetyltransferase
MSLLPLQTDRLRLRDFVVDDWRAVHAYAADPEAVRYMEWGPNDEATTRMFVERVTAVQHAQPRLDFDLAITLRVSGELIGSCGFHIADPQNRAGWIGYILAPGHWGHGYATEAARALLRLGFVDCGLHRIWATCDPRNMASAHVLEKLEMRREGHLRENKLQRGNWRDSYLYAILDTEFRSQESE